MIPHVGVCSQAIFCSQNLYVDVGGA